MEELIKHYEKKDIDKLIDSNEMLISFNDMVFDFSIGKYRNIQKSDYIMTTTGYNAPIEKNDKIRDDLNNIVKSIFEKEDNIKAGKFPTSVTHDESLESKIGEIRGTIKFQMKKVLTLGVAVGHVNMSDEEIVKNVAQAVNFLVSLLKKNWQNVRSLHIKSSMGSPQRLF